MDLSFSQRMGITPEKKPMQLESMDDDLRNGLWNAFKLFIFDNLDYTQQNTKTREYFVVCKSLWHYFYKLPIDTIPDSSRIVEKNIRERYFNSEWFKVFDFLEFVISIDTTTIKRNRGEFVNFCNDILEREFSGYRFVDLRITPITNATEISEIEEALQETSQFTTLKGANTHLTSALAKLSDRQSPDYRNSIKESISAVETTSKLISGKESDTLNSALDRIKDKTYLHHKLVLGYKQIYNYTSDSDGIRHGLMDEPNLDFEDAKYMLVSCSAFINYLIVKADKAGIKFED